MRALNVLDPDRVELAGLDPRGDVAIDLIVGDLRIAAPHPALTDPPQLQDLQHPNQVCARGDDAEPEQRHHRGPACVEVAAVVGVGNEAQRDRECRDAQRPGVEVEDGASLTETDPAEAMVEVVLVGVINMMTKEFSQCCC